MALCTTESMTTQDKPEVTGTVGATLWCRRTRASACFRVFLVLLCARSGKFVENSLPFRAAQLVGALDDEEFFVVEGSCTISCSALVDMDILPEGFASKTMTTMSSHWVHRSTFLFRVDLTGACMWANADVAHAQGAAWRRRQRRLRAHWRHEQLTLLMLLATYEHHAAPRGQSTARSGGWERAVLHGHVPEHPTPQAAGTEYFFSGRRRCACRRVAAGPAVCRVRTARPGTAAHRAADCRNRPFADS